MGSGKPSLATRRIRAQLKLHQKVSYNFDDTGHAGGKKQSILNGSGDSSTFFCVYVFC
jgi:hypothetical protein